MRKLRLGITLSAIAALPLMVLRLEPSSWFKETPFANSFLGDYFMGIIFYILIYFMGLQTLQYFRRPAFRAQSLFAILIATPFMMIVTFGSDNVHLGLRKTVLGLIFLLSIGFFEELFARGFIYGILLKHGRTQAIFFSSLLFGLMHLNLYIGANWDPWLAYWHVMDAGSFGVFVCALMIVTRSIWVGVVFHAIADWTLVFDKDVAALPGQEKWNPSLWTGLTHPLLDSLMFVFMAVLILKIDKGSMPKWIYRISLKWKLITPSTTYQLASRFVTPHHGLPHRHFLLGPIFCARPSQLPWPLILRLYLLPGQNYQLKRYRGQSH